MCPELVPCWCLPDHDKMIKIERIVPMYPLSKDQVKYETADQNTVSTVSPWGRRVRRNCWSMSCRASWMRIRLKNCLST